MSRLIRNIIAPRRRRGMGRIWTLSDEDSGQPLLEFDAFLGLDYAQDARVPQQPSSKDHLPAYNKVGTPYMLKDDAGAQRQRRGAQDLLRCSGGAGRGTRLVSVVTPERVYRSASITSLRWQRTAENGADRVIAELTLEEIRQVAPVYQDMPPETVRDPADASPRDGGKRQASPATEAQQKKSDSVLYDIIT